MEDVKQAEEFEEQFDNGASVIPFADLSKRMSGIYIAIPVFSKGYRPKQGKVAP